ncbi:MAG TPA: hypothetical protein DHU79_01955 [Clostridiales bacterium]|nr:hypothetical protein [Clostridiales bacterium]
MKITIVCDVLGKENNGTTIAAMNRIKYLREHGHEVRVLCCDQDRFGKHKKDNVATSAEDTATNAD